MEINGVAFKQDPGGTQGASQSLADNFETFLTLLTTQLANQDPLNPLEANEFTQQLVGFSAVEQAIATNQNLEQMISLQTDNLVGGAVGYIGRNAEVLSDQLLLSEGSAQLTYGLDGPAESVVVTIVDQHGATVRTFQGETGFGRHQLVWDGRSDYGHQLPDGVYGFFATAVDAEGKTVGTTTATTGRITGVELSDGEVTLNMGPISLPLSAVFAIREDAPAA